jgi:hypothetical protein
MKGRNVKQAMLREGEEKGERRKVNEEGKGG